MRINAKELRQHLTDYLQRAARGHSVEISIRGKPVARLTSLQAGMKQAKDDLFGIWSDRKDMDVEAHVRGMRQGRSF